MKATVHLELEAKRLPADADAVLLPFIARQCQVHEGDIAGYAIAKRSLDARQKPRVKLLYSLTVDFRPGVLPANVAPCLEQPALPLPANKTGIKYPLIVGSGPAGLFAALVLAEAGACPIVLERGRDVVRRKQDIELFFATRQLNEESNLLYGEGGAGTWSDGKLFTRVKDPRAAFVLDTFVQAGAPPEIRYFSHPHIGSDRLPSVIAAIRQRIIEKGGSFLWDTCVKSIIGGSRFKGVRLTNGESLDAPAALIACGHSARRLIESMSSQLDYSMKGFQLGCRIEHPQSFINKTQYGVELPYPALGAAEYLYSARGATGSQGATTFCMCPGGEIIPATCEAETLCTNGMSNSSRDGHFANSAVISTLDATAFKTSSDAYAFLRKLESRLFTLGGADYGAPAQKAEDFLACKASTLPSGTSYRLGLVPGRLDQVLPHQIVHALANALRCFEHKAPGFVKLGTFIGMETRVSSPVRFTRNPETLQSSMANLYLAGEGSGMAGGITSAAIDGIKLAEKMLEN